MTEIIEMRTKLGAIIRVDLQNAMFHDDGSISVPVRLGEDRSVFTLYLTAPDIEMLQRMLRDASRELHRAMRRQAEAKTPTNVEYD